MRWLVIEAPFKVLPNIGPIQQCVRLLIDQEENYKFQVLDVPIDSGKLNNTSLHIKYLNQMKPNSGYDIYPGVEDQYLKIKDKLKRKPIVLHEWPRGTRYDHVNSNIIKRVPTVMPKLHQSHKINENYRADSCKETYCEKDSTQIHQSEISDSKN